MATILGQGFIGSFVAEQLQIKSLSRNDALPNNAGPIIVAAPTGNRIQVNCDPIEDFKNCQNLAEKLNACDAELILISTVDVFCDTAYGQNRRWLENNINANKILRLPMLCHSSIQKNFLYDLKHEQYLDKFNLKSTFQFYPLINLINDINHAVDSDQKILNLTSPPLSVESIVTRYKPQLLNTMSTNNVPEVHYNVQGNHAQYHVTYNDITVAIDDYFSN